LPIFFTHSNLLRRVGQLFFVKQEEGGGRGKPIVLLQPSKLLLETGKKGKNLVLLKKIKKKRVDTIHKMSKRKPKPLNIWKK